MRRWKKEPGSPRFGPLRAAVCLALALSPAGLLWSQTVPRTTLTGTVVDESTGEPVPYVNVYISGSTLGSSTNELGSFEIRSVPVGVHEVVASHVAYSPFVGRIRFLEGQDRTVKISLKPKTIDFGEVEVTAEDPAEWRKNLATFKRLFLGSTLNASLCTIQNPEVLDFKTDESGNFLATSRTPLMLENKALGYAIEYAVETFSCNGSFLRVSAKPRFAELEPASELEKQFWVANRLRAYRGSLRHFLVALIHRRVLEEGFRVSSVEGLGQSPWPQSHSAIDWEGIVSQGSVSYETIVNFNHYLEVEYLNEDIEKGYDLLRHGQSEKQTSWIKMNGGFITVSAEGDIKEPFPLTIFGYWAWERVADLLPLDYVPPALK